MEPNKEKAQIFTDKGNHMEHNEKVSGDTQKVTDANAVLANPLGGRSREQLIKDADEFCEEQGMQEHKEMMRKAAQVAASPVGFDDMEDLTEEEKASLRLEFTHKWKQPKQLWMLVVSCAMAAVVQGQDQSLINGANIFYPEQFGIAGNDNIIGLINAAPYFACVVFACWTTEPLNHYLGRRGTILFTLIFACVPCIWAGLSPSWQVLLASRFVLSMGIGPKSSTVPIFAAECAPPAIRGALVMMWQMWTAFGIMIGYICSLIFYNVSSSSIEGLNWRLMLGSGAVPPMIVFAQVIFLPESPRWLLQKGRPVKALDALRRLRNSEIEAFRDLFAISANLKAELTVKHGNRFIELFTIPRNRRATQAAGIVMFMQQFCGINVIAYYSSTILVQANLGQFQALLGSFGFGVINWLFAFPAVWTIDRFGRRNLLLTTFPMMAFWLAFTGSMFYLPDGDGRTAGILLGIYFFAMAYSPGEGPVPFTYSAEAFPLYIRAIGMSFATATCWGFNGILAFTFPSLQTAFTPSGAFYYYAAWNIVGWFLVLLFVPETKQLSLEELDQVFSVPTRKHARYGLGQPKYFVQKYIMRKDVKSEPLYVMDPSLSRTYAPKAAGH